MTKEDAYDNEISPLMAQIIAICNREKIAVLATFQLTPDDVEGGGLACTTALLTDEYEPSAAQLKALDIVNPPPPVFAAFTITTRKA